MTDLKASARRILVLDPELLSPNLNYDFTSKRDDGTRYERGGYTYSRPYGWYRYALKVNGKYNDDIWLGEHRNRTESTPGEWPVSFHGTAIKNVKGIAMHGYQLSRSMREKYGRGIYSSPSIKVAEVYAKPFECESKKYKVVFQNRVNSNGLKVIPVEKVCRDRSDGMITGDYWIQTCEDYIRPYGICIKPC